MVQKPPGKIILVSETRVCRLDSGPTPWVSSDFWVLRSLPNITSVSKGLAVWPEDDKSVHLNKLPKGKEIEIDISQNLATWEMVDFLKDLFYHERITMQKSPWRNSIDLFFCK